MTQKSFTFFLNYLKSCVLCASDETHRYYLNGVCLQYDGAANLVAIATDGHRMVCFNVDFAKEGYDIEPFSMIIPKQIIEGIKVDKTIKNVSLVLSTSQEKPYLQYGHNKYYFDPIDGTFPEWQRVVPTALSHVVAQFNPKYIMDFQKIRKIWGKDSYGPSIAHNGTGPALINLNLVAEKIEGFGVIMPYRDEETPKITHPPLWATGFRLPVKQVA